MPTGAADLGIAFIVLLVVFIIVVAATSSRKPAPREKPEPRQPAPPPAEPASPPLPQQPQPEHPAPVVPPPAAVGPRVSEVMSIALAVPGTPVAAGGTLDGTLTIRNRGDEVDRMIVQISGVDPDWYSLSPPEVNLFPGDQEQVQVSLHPPRTSGARAGRHPVTVIVRSTAHPAEYVTGHIELDILPFYGTAFELRPRRVTVGTGQDASYTLVAANNGNTPVTLFLSGQDDEAALEFRFPTPQVTVEPGLSQPVPFAAAPRQQWRGQARQYAFTVSGQVPGGRDTVRAGGELVATGQAPVASQPEAEILMQQVLEMGRTGKPAPGWTEFKPPPKPSRWPTVVAWIIVIGCIVAFLVFVLNNGGL